MREKCAVTSSSKRSSQRPSPSACRELQLRAEERRFELGQPVAAVAEVFQHWRQVRQRVGVDVSDGGIVLIAGQAPGSVVHLAGSEQFEHLLLRVHGVRAGLSPATLLTMR